MGKLATVVSRAGRQGAFCFFFLSVLSAPIAAPAGELAIASTPSASSLPIDIAFAHGYFAAEGVRVRPVECTSGPRCMGQLFERAVQFAAVSELPVVFNSFDRADYAIVATLVTSTRNINLIGRKSAGITGPQGLLGKKIGVIVGSSSHYFLDAYLLFHGIDPRQVRVVALQSENMPGAIESRQVDALAGYSRHTGPVAKALGNDAVVLENPRIYTDSYNLIVDRRTLSEREDDVVKVLRALARAQQFIAAHPQRAKEILGARARLDPAFVEAIFPGFNYRLSLNQSLVSAMEGEARWALREGHVGAGRKMPNYLEFVASGPLRKAAPNALAH
jgi:NitT/TauT family transport system substrate-binding protein